MTSINVNSRPSSFGESLLSELHDLKHSASSYKNTNKTEQKKSGSPSFLDHLENGIKSVNESQKLSDKAATDLATGKKQNIHETMLAASQAEITFNLMVQVRNKALEAYQEVMRMPV